MFDPAKTFLLGRSDKLSVTDQARGGVAVVRIQAKDERHGVVILICCP